MTRRKPERKSTANPAVSLSRQKVWCFRLIALLAVPVLFSACLNRAFDSPVLDIQLRSFAIELNPSDSGLRPEAGRVLSALSRHEDAARQYLSAVELAPEQAQPHIQLGVELGRLGKRAPAEQEFRQALRFDPDFVDARMDLGVALYKQEKLEEALKEFEETLQRNPGNATALRYIQLLRNQTPLPTVR